MDDQEHRGVTLGEACDLERRVRRHGLSSLSDEERAKHERAQAGVRTAFPAKYMESVARQFRQFHQTSHFERQAYRDLTPAQVLALRRSRDVGRRPTGSRRVARPRRAGRAGPRGDPHLDDDEEIDRLRAKARETGFVTIGELVEDLFGEVLGWASS